MGGLNDYKISLGIDLDTSDLQEQINAAGKIAKPIKLDIEFGDINKDIKAIKTQLDSIGKKGGLSLNTQSLEESLRVVTSLIKDVKTTLGTIDNGSGMKSLLSSVNQIATALGKVTDESNTLVKSLNTLASKDFNINLGIDMNKKNLSTIGYGRAARKQVIPELESQIKYLENLFGGQQATMNKLASQGRNVGFDVFTDFGDFNSDSAIKKMEAMEKYINSLKKLAALDNVNLDGFNEIHKDATSLINDITGVENAVNKAGDVPEKLKNLFGGSIDGEGLSKQLDSIVVDLGEIKTAIQGLSQNNAIDGLTQSFDRLSDTLEQLMTNAKLVQDVLSSGLTSSGANTDANAINQTKKAVEETVSAAKQLDNIAIEISDGNIDELKNALKNLKVDDTSIENATKELNEMNVAAKSVSGTLKNGNIAKWDIKGVQTTVDGLQRAVTVTKTLGKEGWESSIKYSQSLDKIAIAAEKVNQKLRSGTNGNTKFDVEISDVESKFGRLSNQSVELRTKIDLLKQELTSIQTASAKGDLEDLVAANERYEKALQDVNNQLKLNAQAEREAATTQKLVDDGTLFQSKIDLWLTKNSKAAKQYGATLLDLKAKAENCDRTTLNHLEAEFKQVDKAADTAGLKTQKFGDSLKSQFDKYASYFSVASLFMYVEQGLRSMFEQVKLIDSAMTELKKVTDETDASYNKFLTNAATRSREIGTTIDGLVSSTADFARLGYDFVDAQGLAEVANIYAVVGDEIEGVEGATESLISTMAAFKDEMNGMSNADFAMNIIDKFNEIGNNFAISSGGIGEALERSASSLMAANNTIDESIALITAANTVVQHPEAVGTAFKTISMRIRGAKTELEEAGLETDGMVESTAKLREEILALSGVDIMENANEFKSTYQIMDELAQKWEDLTDIQQAKCLPDNVEMH